MDKLDRDTSRSGAQGTPGGAQDQSNNLRFENITYKMQVPMLGLERTATPLTCNFEYVVTDRQDKLIMFKHS